MENNQGFLRVIRRTVRKTGEELLQHFPLKLLQYVVVVVDFLLLLLIIIIMIITIHC
jgi:hypothetical protein